MRKCRSWGRFLAIARWRLISLYGWCGRRGGKRDGKIEEEKADVR